MEWKVNLNFPFYMISEYGDVVRNQQRGNFKSGSRVRGSIDLDGYVRYSLFDKTDNRVSIGAHQLVALTFIGEPPTENMEVRHLNGSRLANHYTNLEWSTRKINHQDLQVHGTSAKGERNGRAIVDEQMVRRIRQMKHEMPITQLSKTLNLPYDVVYNIIRNKTWTHIE